MTLLTLRYGCNEIKPRVFDEVQSIYSTDMIDVFSGGLVYEFTQEPNNYGLVIVEELGDITLTADYLLLKSQFELLPETDYTHIASAMRKDVKNIQTRLKTHEFGLPPCEATYQNLDISKGVPESVVQQLIEKGVKVEKGKYVQLTESQLLSKYKIFTPQGQPYPVENKIIPIVDIYSDSRSKGFSPENGTYSDSEYYDSSSDYETDGPVDKLNLFDPIAEFFSNMFHNLSNMFNSN